MTEIAPNTPFLPSFQSLHVVVIGLDSAGKTSLLYRLKLREFVETIPTKGFNMERIKVSMGNSKAGGTTFQVWDVGGQEKLRPLWKSYTRRTDGLVFVVDAAEPERLEEAKVELHRISRSPENQGVPVLVLANKQDRDGALSALEVDACALLGVFHYFVCVDFVHRPGFRFGLIADPRNAMSMFSEIIINRDSLKRAKHL